METLQKLDIEVYKWGGRLRFRWPANLLLDGDEELVVKSAFTKDYVTDYCSFKQGDATVEYYPKGEYYNICKIYRDEKLVGIYSNLATPLKHVHHNVWAYTDLELDLWISADGNILILDEDEYNLLKLNLPAEMQEELHASWQRLIHLAQHKEQYFADVSS